MLRKEGGGGGADGGVEGDDLGGVEAGVEDELANATEAACNI